MDNEQGQSPSQTMTKVISQLLDRGSIGVVITVMTGLETIGCKLLVDEAGQTWGSLGKPELDSTASRYAKDFLNSRTETRTVAVKEFAPEFSTDQEILLLFERLQPSVRLVVCGAGHVGAALARLGRFIGYHTTLIDDRAEFVNPTRFVNEQIELILARDWGDAVRQAVGNGKGVAVAVVTRGHNEDEECMRAVIGTNPDYVGLIGSKRRTNIVIDNLRRAGATEVQLEKIRAPIGLDIGAVSPEEVALAIIAEMVADRRGGKGGSLSAWRRA
jgi:xanthine dehydrogenase accessory factor